MFAHFFVFIMDFPDNRDRKTDDQSIWVGICFLHLPSPYEFRRESRLSPLLVPEAKLFAQSTNTTTMYNQEDFLKFDQSQVNERILKNQEQWI